jgi:hypothetical protein
MIPQVPADRDLFTVAKLSVQFQVSFVTMQAALDVLDIGPELCLNGLPYYGLIGDRAELLREYLDTRRHNDQLNRGAKWTSDLPVPTNYKPVQPGNQAAGG